MDELLLAVFAAVDFGKGAQFGVRAEDQVDTGACPLDLVRLAVTAFEHVLRVGRGAPRCSEVQQVHEEVIRELAWVVREDAVGRSVEVGIEHAHAAHKGRHLGCRQRQQLCLVNQQFFRRDGIAGLLVVAESVGHGLEHGERLNIGLLLRSVHTARREGHRNGMSGIGSGLLDSCAATKHDQVGQRHLRTVRLRGVEGTTHALQGIQHLRQLGGIIHSPEALGGKADTGAVGAAALVGTAEGRR